MTPISLDATGLALTAGGAVGGRRLIDGLSFRVAPGERWLVIGPNGAGKSSLLAALAGVFPLAAGTIRIDARAIEDWPPAALARRRAWSPQFWSDPFPATVRETVALARREARKVGRAREVRARNADLSQEEADALADEIADEAMDRVVARARLRWAERSN